MELKVFIHSKDGCPYCVEAKSWLDQHGIPFKEVLHNDDAERQAFYDSLGLHDRQRSVPQIIMFDGDEFHRIGGLADLKVSRMETLWQTNGEARSERASELRR